MTEPSIVVHRYCHECGVELSYDKPMTDVSEESCVWFCTEHGMPLMQATPFVRPVLFEGKHVCYCAAKVAA